MRLRKSLVRRYLQLKLFMMLSFFNGPQYNRDMFWAMRQVVNSLCPKSALLTTIIARLSTPGQANKNSASGAGASHRPPAVETDRDSSVSDNRICLNLRIPAFICGTRRQNESGLSYVFPMPRLVKVRTKAEALGIADEPSINWRINLNRAI